MKQILCLAVILFAGCSTSQYLPPRIVAPLVNSYSTTLPMSFDSAWAAIIQYFGTSSYHIDNFEKASGLLIISFTASNPAELISGGTFRVRGNRNYDGGYVEYLVGEAETLLQGTVNVLVDPEASHSTRVMIKASYSFTITLSDAGTSVFSFDTGTSDTRLVFNGVSVSPDTVTIIPTHRLESSLLNALSRIGDDHSTPGQSLP
jgi:hypothetical protein